MIIDPPDTERNDNLLVFPKSGTDARSPKSALAPWAVATDAQRKLNIPPIALSPDSSFGTPARSTVSDHGLRIVAAAPPAPAIGLLT